MPRREGSASDEVRVAHRDDELLVLYKPPGLPTTAPERGESLAELAPSIDPRAPRLHPSSRLDAEVSGLVTFARTRRATKALLRARRQGRYGRTYLGLATGAPEPEQGRWQEAIGIDPTDPRRRVVGTTAGARRVQDAETRYDTGAHAHGASVLWLRPVTGRTHQLRVHAAAAGVPLLGDVVYGGPRRVVRDDGRVVTPRRTMLHCAALSLPDVARGGVLSLLEPAPEDLARIWRELGGAAEALEPAPG